MIFHSKGYYNIVLVYGDRYCSMQVQKDLILNKDVPGLERYCEHLFKQMIQKDNLSARLGYYLRRFWYKCKDVPGWLHRDEVRAAGYELLEAIDEDQST